MAATPANPANPTSFQRLGIRLRRLRTVTTAVLRLDDAVATAATGDVWLFRGRSFADLVVPFALQGEVAVA